jgi:N-acetylneuraminate lyase
MHRTVPHRALEGIIPALHTAYDAQEEIDFNVQRDLVRRLVSQGVHGLFLCGTSAEFPFLSLEEREKLTELVVAEVVGQVPIIVHVGAPRPTDAVRLAQHAARLGVQALSSAPPYYYSYRPDAIIDYLQEIATSTELPFYYYHLPERTGVSLDERLWEQILSVPNLAGIKYSHGDLAFQQRLLEIAGPRLRLFCGSDEILLPSLVAGASGAIGSTYNFLAPLFLPLWNAYRDGKIAEARVFQARASKLIAVLMRYPGIAASKEALRLLGIDVGPPRLPLSRLTSDEKDRFNRELLAAGLLEINGLK